jgi:predicted TIM-barrel fold metal-dependent hydrolase
MSRTAVISVDGHVRASRQIYRDYVESRYLEDYDDWARSVEGTPDTGNRQPNLDPEVRWDSDRRLADLESNGVVAEVLFPNGLPFQTIRFEDLGRAITPELTREARLAHNRWLVDFCAAVPGRRCGQALVSFHDVDQAVQDIVWAKEHGLGGIMMPALTPGDTFFFDPALDPIWATIEEIGLPISQHGGSGTPAYNPPGFAALMTLALEHSFFSGRSLWQMILGGVFERFPNLKMVFVETEADWIAPIMRKLDRRLSVGDDWLGFSRYLQRERSFSKTAHEYWETNCFAGISPFTCTQVPVEELATPEGVAADGGDFHISAERAMFGVDYPHFESIFPTTRAQVTELVSHPAVSEEAARGILFENAATVYGFDLPQLAGDIERVGFDLAELSSLAPAS